MVDATPDFTPHGNQGDCNGLTPMFCGAGPFIATCPVGEVCLSEDYRPPDQFVLSSRQRRIDFRDMAV